VGATPWGVDTSERRRRPQAVPLRRADRSHLEQQPRERTDLRRLAATGLSGLLPGLGQLANGRSRLAVRLLLPTVAVVAVVALVAAIVPPLQILASLVSPTALSLLGAASLAVLGWRSFAVLQAFFDRRYPRRPSPLALGGLVVVLGLVTLPHLVAHWYIGAAREAFGQSFAGTETSELTGDARAAAAASAPTERVNVLLVGVDSGPGRDHELTDTLVLASLDPVGGTATLISIPRDTAMVPLGNGDTYGPRINSLYGYAAAHRAAFPAGPMRTLQDAVGALLGVDVDYYATIDMAGFSRLVDAAGGVTVTVKKGFRDPTYRYAPGVRGWGIEPGVHRLDGADALAFVRIRKAPGESDFTRADRQQQVLVALYRGLLAEGGLLLRVPELLRSVGSMVETDLPPALLPGLAAVADDMSPADIIRLVIKAPLLAPMKSDYGNVWVPRLDRIAALTTAILAEPGWAPAPWPRAER
jgi:LCP family protein required for cell wall assembly